MSVEPRFGSRLVTPGSYEIDRGHPLSAGLVYALVGGQELVSQSAARVVSPLQQVPVSTRGGIVLGLRQTAGNNGYAYTRKNGRLQTVKHDFTMVFAATVTSTNGYLFSIPYAASTWNSNSAGVLAINYNPGASRWEMMIENPGGTAFNWWYGSGPTVGGTSPHAVQSFGINRRLSGGTSVAQFWTNGTMSTSYARGESQAMQALDWNSGNYDYPTVFSRSSSANASNGAGYFGYMFIFDRALTGGQITWVERNWQKLLKPKPSRPLAPLPPPPIPASVGSTFLPGTHLKGDVSMTTETPVYVGGTIGGPYPLTGDPGIGSGVNLTARISPVGGYSEANTAPRKVFFGGDSWVCGACHGGGNQVASATFQPWSGTVFYNLQRGLSPNQITYGYAFDILDGLEGVDKRGCSTDGLFIEQLRAHLDGNATVTVGFEGAVMGSKIEKWAGDVPAGNGMPPSGNIWYGLAQAIAAEPNPIVIFDGGGNDAFKVASGIVIAPTPDPYFDNTWLPSLKTWWKKVVDYIVAIAPTVELVIPTYTNMMVFDGAPYHYPPHSPAEPGIATSVWVTQSFGYYQQWNLDSIAAVNAWALAKATAEYIALGSPWWFSIPNRKSYWYSTMLGPFPLGAVWRDIVTGGYEAIGLYPNYWKDATANINPDTIMPIWHKIAEAQKYAANFYVGHPTAKVTQIDCWKPTTMEEEPAHAIYAAENRAPAEAYWADTAVHLTCEGYRRWIDFILETWLPTSSLKNQTAPGVDVDGGEFDGTVESTFTPPRLSGNVTVQDFAGTIYQSVEGFLGPPVNPISGYVSAATEYSPVTRGILCE